MIKTKKDSRYEIDYDKKVFVYKNLHRGCWSVKQGGLVKAHSTDEPILLYNAQMKVNKGGRDRVLRDKRKNVHAGIEGYLKPPSKIWECWNDLKEFMSITYNPYKNTSFIDKHTGDPVWFACFVKMCPQQVLVSKQ